MNVLFLIALQKILYALERRVDDVKDPRHELYTSLNGEKIKQAHGLIQSVVEDLRPK